jgi:hypothetical protein
MLEVLADGEPRTSRELAIALFGPAAAIPQVPVIMARLRVLEKRGAVVRDAEKVCRPPTGLFMLFRWRKVPGLEPPACDQKPEAGHSPAAAAQRPEKGITPEDLEWMEQHRELAARKAARAMRAGRG